MRTTPGPPAPAPGARLIAASQGPRPTGDVAVDYTKLVAIRVVDQPEERTWLGSWVAVSAKEAADVVGALGRHVGRSLAELAEVELPVERDDRP